MRFRKSRSCSKSRGLALLAVATVALSAGCGPLDPDPGDLSEVAIHGLIDSYAEAIETNNRELALFYIHKRFPSRTNLEAELRDQLASYQERAEITQIEVMTHPDGTTSARVDQDFIRIFGLRIVGDSRQRIFRFRLQDGIWRIWSIEQTPSSGQRIDSAKFQVQNPYTSVELPGLMCIGGAPWVRLA